MCRAASIIIIAALTGCSSTNAPAPSSDATIAAQFASVDAQRARTRDARMVLLHTRLPLNPFANAKKGDWWAYVARAFNVYDGKLDRRTGVLVWRVDDAIGDDVVVREECRGEIGIDLGPVRIFDRDEPPLVIHLLPSTKNGLLTDLPDMRPGPTDPFLSAAKASFEDERRTIGGAPMDVRKTTLVLLFERAGPATISFATSASAKNAIVCASVKYAGADDAKSRLDLAGYGNGATVEWGKSPDELVATLDREVRESLSELVPGHPPKNSEKQPK